MTKKQLLKAIRRQCVECMGNQPSLIEGCTSPKCSLYPMRMGEDPTPARKGPVLIKRVPHSGRFLKAEALAHG